MKHKEKYGFKLNELVFVWKENRWGLVCRIDDHVYPICLTTGGRYLPEDLEKDLTNG